MTAQAIVEDSTAGANNPIAMRIPFARVTKAEYLIPLLNEQLEKNDRARR